MKGGFSYLKVLRNNGSGDRKENICMWVWQVTEMGKTGKGQQGSG